MDKGDFRFWSVVVAAVATVCTLVTGPMWLSFRHSENMARLGYEEAPVPGVAGCMWRKVQAAPENRLASPVPLGRLVEEYVMTNALRILDDYVMTNALRMLDGYAVVSPAFTNDVGHLAEETEILLRQ